MKLIFSTIGIGLMVLTVPTAAGKAQEFRIETKIFNGNESIPYSQNLTLFAEHLVYDFMYPGEKQTQVQEIVIYDAINSRFVLINPEREIKTELSKDELERIVEAMKSDPKMKSEFGFLIDTKFRDLSNGKDRLELRSEKISYVATGEDPKDDQHFNLYIKFLNAYTKLNATNAKPPFARLQLNELIKSNRIVPNEVRSTLTIGSRLVPHTIEARSSHEIIWRLAKKDRQLIENANELWTNCVHVRFSEFRNID